jgi:hypothetical protein
MRGVAAGIAAQRERGEQAKHSERCSHQRRLVGTPAFLGPVDVVEMEQHCVIARPEGDDRCGSPEAGEDAGDEVVQVDVANGAASPTPVPADPGAGADGSKSREKGEQEKEQRLSAAAIDVVAVAGDELEEVRR